MCITFRIYILIGRFVLLINALGLDSYSGRIPLIRNIPQ